MWKVIGPLNVKKFYAKCEKVLVNSILSIGKFGRPGQFLFDILWFRGVNT